MSYSGNKKKIYVPENAVYDVLQTHLGPAAWKGKDWIYT